MTKRKRYLALKWKITFTVIPVISMIAIFFYVLTFQTIKIR